MLEPRPTVLSIAGYDPSSGAGVTADIKTIAAHGCFGVTCITALTVQTTQGVRRVQAVAGKLVAETLEELVFDVALTAVRIASSPCRIASCRSATVSTRGCLISRNS